MGVCVCNYCGAVSEKPNSQINRSIASGNPLFCNRKCFGLSRRTNKSLAQKKKEKREYDEEYRKKNRDLLKAKKAAYFKRTYDPEKARIHRASRMRKHIEYCRTAKYRAWKKEYDRKYRARKFFGPFWESFIALQDLETEVFSRQPRASVKYQNGATNKTQNRRREYVRQTNSR